MRRPAEIEHIVRVLKADLEPVQPVRGSVVRMEVPPLLGEACESTIPYVKAVTPACPLPLRDVAERFDTLTSTGRVNLPRRAQRYFVGSDPGRFLFWAANCPEVSALDVDLDEGRMLIIGEFTFGFADGQLITPRDVVPHADTSALNNLATVGICRSRDETANALYIKARALGRTDAMRAIAAIHHYTPYRWSVLAPWVREGVAKTGVAHSALDKVAGILDASSDPVCEMYFALVPSAMTVEHFDRVFGPIEGRPINPDESFRRRLWQKLSDELLQP